MTVRRKRKCMWYVWVGGFFIIIASYTLMYIMGMLDACVAESGSAWQNRYWQAVSTADGAVMSEDWHEAIRQYNIIVDLMPHDPVAHYNRATALARLGRNQESINALELSVTLGLADVDRLTSDPTFEAVRKISGFALLIEHAVDIADTPIALYIPDQIDPNKPCPLIVAFHGVGENPHSYIQTWKSTADHIGCVVVAPGGNKRMGSNGNNHSRRWVSDDTIKQDTRLLPIKTLLHQSITLAKKQANIDDHKILLAGFSQGGSVALTMLADAPESYCGAVVQATSFGKHTLDRWHTPSTPSRNVLRVFVIVHEFDRIRDNGEQAYHALVNLGVDTRRHTVAGADHEHPLDNRERQIEAVRFVLGDEPAEP